MKQQDKTLIPSFLVTFAIIGLLYAFAYIASV